jgi:hypothetical protein
MPLGSSNWRTGRSADVRRAETLVAAARTGGYDASVSPLVLLTLLVFFALIVAALLVWTLLAPRRREPDGRPTPRPRTATNDEVRGAKKRPSERPATEDAFERFLKAGRDEPQ